MLYALLINHRVRPVSTGASLSTEDCKLTFDPSGSFDASSVGVLGLVIILMPVELDLLGIGFVVVVETGLDRFVWTGTVTG
jgi:hypothetical protein